MKSKVISLIIPLLTTMLVVLPAKASGMPATIIEPYIMQNYEFYEKFKGVGQVKYSNSQYGIAQKSGTAEYITSKQGQQVSKGDVLILIDSTTTKQELKTAEAELRHAKAALKRDESLYAKKIISEDKLEGSRVELERSILGVVKAREDLQDLVIVAPFDGIIDVIKPRVGDEINMGDKLFTIISAGTKEIIVELPQTLNNKLDQSTKIYTAATDQSKAYGKLIAISPSLSESGTLATRVEFDENTPLIHDSYIKITFEYNRHKGLSIPEKAIMKNNTGDFVYKINNENKVEQLYVTTGIRTDGNIEILSDNLSLGDKIVLEGLTKVFDGSEVQYDTPEEK